MDEPPWLLFLFSLPSKQASARVELWRKLKASGAIALPTSGHLLPNGPAHLERFQWLAEIVRKSRGSASVAQVFSIEGKSSDELKGLFAQARAADYESLIGEVKRLASAKAPDPRSVTRLRRRFQQIAQLDFFQGEARERAEGWLRRLDSPRATTPGRRVASRKGFSNRVWLTRPGPGIDRVACAWLIRRFIDPQARFAFAEDPDAVEDAIPYDMFQEGRFRHHGESCTFEVMSSYFRIAEPKVAAIAQIVHDADIADDKYGRAEGTGLDRVLVGWAKQGLSDDEILRRGMEMIDGLFHTSPSPA